MADLIEKYFRSELTEAEEQALASQLDASEVAADRFAEKAEQAYFSFGLAEPRVPGQPGRLMRFLRSTWGRVLPIVAVAGGAAAFHYWPRIVYKPEATVVIAPGEHLQAAPAFEGKKEVRLLSPTSLSTTSETKPMPVDSGEAPPNPGFDTDYRNLKVVVDQESVGKVVVRVLGPNGTEVRRLYEGPLQAGKWSFTWDGILSDGRAAVPGIYRIEVQGAAASKSREVIIR